MLTLEFVHTRKRTIHSSTYTRPIMINGARGFLTHKLLNIPCAYGVNDTSTCPYLSINIIVRNAIPKLCPDSCTIIDTYATHYDNIVHIFDRWNLYTHCPDAPTFDPTVDARLAHALATFDDDSNAPAIAFWTHMNHAIDWLELWTQYTTWVNAYQKTHPTPAAFSDAMIHAPLFHGPDAHTYSLHDLAHTIHIPMDRTPRVIQDRMRAKRYSITRMVEHPCILPPLGQVFNPSIKAPPPHTHNHWIHTDTHQIRCRDYLASMGVRPIHASIQDCITAVIDTLHAGTLHA